MKGYWRSSALFSIGLFILLSSAGLAACGTNPTQASGPTAISTAVSTGTTAPTTIPTTAPITSSATPTIAATNGTANNTAVPTHAIGASTPALPVSPPVQPTNTQNCGVVDTSSLHRLQDAGLTQQAGECFWQAFQQCHSATLLFHDGGAGTSTNHSFFMQSRNGTCTIIDTVSLKTTPQGTFTCTGLIKSAGFLRFTNCGAEGNIAVQLI